MSGPKRILVSRIYDKRKPGDQRGIALLHQVVEDGAEPQIVFGCQQYAGGVCFLNKQHAIEFASAMLMMALQLPGDVPEGDVRLPNMEEDG
jgi:hypothetical protein